MHNQLCLNLGAIAIVVVVVGAAVYAPIAVSLLGPAAGCWLWRLISPAKKAPS